MRGLYYNPSSLSIKPLLRLGQNLINFIYFSRCITYQTYHSSSSKMAITEIVTKTLKQDSETQTKFYSEIKPLMSIIGSTPGIKRTRYMGQMITENNINVESAK